MSLEAKIEALTQAVIALTNKLEFQTVPATAPNTQSLIVTPVAQAPVVQAPVVQAPVVQAPVVQAPAMPQPPTFQPAAPAPAVVPFSDPKGLIDYVMGAYKALGPQKGAQIQNVLTSLGYQNINDVKPEHYGALFAGVEALRG